ncbi:hypothetical protein FN846DRAFT_909665 [Sphaerosporella brunnea]|uniref:Uncharacterized protein n=1 Tax=Sphaerosporella brunnea TaxID=1250544 RepID=A0A5J5EQJ2_9PEZI|nr:hypothetical protein FN846DRAFT_909665 [Sphaerosporella brunnea]
MLISEPKTHRVPEDAFPNILAVPPQITLLPLLKFVVPGSPRIYYIPHDQIQTYQGLERVVRQKLEIDLEAVLDMCGHCIDSAAWTVVKLSWPYCLGTFTVIGKPVYSESLVTLKFRGKPLEIKFALPRPQNLTVGTLRRIMLGYMGCLQKAGELPALGFLPSDLNDLDIAGVTSDNLVKERLHPDLQLGLDTPTLFVVPTVLVDDVDDENLSHGTACTFIVVQTQWIKLHAIRREPIREVLMAPATTICQVKAIIEKLLFKVLRVDHDDRKDEVILEHEVLVRNNDGHWTDIPRPLKTTLRSLQRTVQSVMNYRDRW